LTDDSNHGADFMTDQPDVSIRAEEPGDLAAIRAVVDDAFGAEDHVSDLVDALRASDDSIEGMSFVAVEDGSLVGHVMFTRSRLDSPTRLIDVLVLSPLAVAPRRQGRGIGSALVRHGLAKAARRPEPLVFLEGSPNYYGRFGFVAGESLGFRRPSLRIPPAAFQVFPLPGHQPWMTGTLVYSEVFWRLDSVGLRDADGTTWPD
jgi:putative acetyltransferase